MNSAFLAPIKPWLIDVSKVLAAHFTLSSLEPPMHSCHCPFFWTINLDQASTYFPNWTVTPGNSYILQYNASLNPTDQVVITFPAMNRILVSISISADVLPWSQTCNVNQAEFTLGGKWVINPTAPLQDTYDISLNDGFNYPMEIKPDSGTAAMVCCSLGNSTAPGVYPLGASTCTSWDGTSANCPGPQTEVHGTNAQGAPNPPCQYAVSPTNYTVYIGGIPPDVPTSAPTWCPGTCP